jgi:hypothetical protein
VTLTVCLIQLAKARHMAKAKVQGEKLQSYITKVVDRDKSEELSSTVQVPILYSIRYIQIILRGKSQQQELTHQTVHGKNLCIYPSLRIQK